MTNQEAAAVRAGLAAYTDGFAAERLNNIRRARGAWEVRPPKRYREGRVREMWVHGWNAALEIELRMRPAQRVAHAAAA